MRKQLLGSLTTLAVAGSLAVGGPAPSADAADGWTTPVVLSTAVGSAPQVVATGYGDAIAAWVQVDGLTPRAYVAVATHGTWAEPAPVSPDGVSVADVRLDARSNQNAVVAWTTSSGTVAVHGRRLTADGWSAPLQLTPALEALPQGVDIGVFASGAAILTVAADLAGGISQTDLYIEHWNLNGVLGLEHVAGKASDPALDVNASGDAVLGYTAGGNNWWTYYEAGAPDWTPAKSEGVSYAPQAVAIGDDGTALLPDEGPTGADVRRVNPDGSPGHLYSLAPAPAANVAVDMNADGDAVFAWETVEDGEAVTGVRTWTAGGYPAPVTLQPPVAGPTAPVASIADDGGAMVTYAAGGRLVVHQRPAGAAGWGAWTGPAADTKVPAADLAADGSAVALATAGVEQPLTAQFRDLAGPSSSLGAWSEPVPETGVALSDGVSFQLGAEDDLGGPVTVDVLARTATWDHAGYGEPTAIADDVDPGSQQVLQGTPGTSYCLAAQASDEAGNLGPVTGETCFAFPLDDPMLTAKKGGWKRLDKKGHYFSTVTKTRRQGAVLVAKGVHARELGLVVARKATGGRVTVHLGKQKLGTFSLKGSGRRSVIEVADFAQLRSGTVRVKVVSRTGKVVQVDGLVATQ